MSYIKTGYYSDDDELNKDNESYNHVGPQKSDLIGGSQGKSIVSNALALGLALLSVLYCLFATTQLVWFLSGNVNGLLKQQHSWPDVTSSEAVFQDLCLLLLFVSQHRFMSKGNFKMFITALLPRQFERSFYLSCTGLAIQCVTSFWINVTGETTIVVWDISGSSRFCLLSQWLHLLSWMYTFIILFNLDFAEFIGLKQVYYHAHGYGCPMSAKTQAARRMFKHFRHPTYIGLAIVLWVVPCMTVDRLLLSSVFTMYLLSTDFDQEDAQYVQEMYEKKLRALS